MATEANAYGLARRVDWAEIVADDPEMAVMFPPPDPEFLRQFRATNPGRLIPLAPAGMFLSLKTLCAHMIRPLVATEANPGEFVIPGVRLTAEVFKTLTFDGGEPHNPLPGIFLYLRRPSNPMTCQLVATGANSNKFAIPEPAAQRPRKPFPRLVPPTGRFQS